MSTSPSEQPRPFAFICFTLDKRHLRWYVQVATCIYDGCDSLRAVHRELLKSDNPDCPSLTTVMQIESHVADLLSSEFGRDVTPFRRTRDGRVIGLTADGIEALRRANEFFGNYHSREEVA